MRRIPLIAAVLSLALALPAGAIADSGGATIHALSDSYELEGHVELNEECEDGPIECTWFGTAAQYPANVVCPAVFDVSHGVWQGELKQSRELEGRFEWTEWGSFSFEPTALNSKRPKKPPRKPNAKPKKLLQRPKKLGTRSKPKMALPPLRARSRPTSQSSTRALTR